MTTQWKWIWKKVHTVELSDWILELKGMMVSRIHFFSKCLLSTKMK